MADTLKIGLYKAKIKETAKEFWHKYLYGKELLVMTHLNGSYILLAIKNEKDLSGLCTYCWENSTDDEKEYDCLEDFNEEVKLGNDGFGFEPDEIEIIETAVVREFEL